MGDTRYRSIIPALQKPEVYPEKFAAVELLETQISNLFLTGEHIYKVKKPGKKDDCIHLSQVPWLFRG